MKSEPLFYTSLPSEPNSQPPQTTTTTVNYVILQNYPHTRHRQLHRLLCTSSLLLLFTSSLFFLFPSNPNLKLSRIHLNHIQINSSHHLSLDLSLSLTLKVRNPDFFSLKYNSLDVSISYRGKELGFVKSNGGEVKARDSSYVDATLIVDGFQIIHDFFYLIEDVAAGKVPFDTVSNINGNLGFFFVDIPLKAKVSCEVDVNPKDQTIVQQNCYPQG